MNFGKSALPGAAPSSKRTGATDTGARLRKGYQYTHDFEEHIADMEFLPDALHGKLDSKPTSIGHVVVIREYLEKVK